MNKNTCMRVHFIGNCIGYLLQHEPVWYVTLQRVVNIWRKKNTIPQYLVPSNDVIGFRTVNQRPEFSQEQRNPLIVHGIAVRHNCPVVGLTTCTVTTVPSAHMRVVNNKNTTESGRKRQQILKLKSSQNVMFSRKKKAHKRLMIISFIICVHLITWKRCGGSGGHCETWQGNDETGEAYSTRPVAVPPLHSGVLVFWWLLFCR